VLTRNPTGSLVASRCVVVRFVDITEYEELFIVLPKCRVTKIWSVISAGLTSNDVWIVAYKNAQAITDGTIIIAESSVTGDIDFCQPSMHNEFNGMNDYLRLTSGGESLEDVIPTLVTIEYELL